MVQQIDIPSYDCTFDKDSQILLSGGPVTEENPSSLIVFQLRDGRVPELVPARRFNFVPHNVHAVEFSPLASNLALCGDSTGAVTGFDLSAQKVVWQWQCHHPSCDPDDLMGPTGSACTAVKCQPESNGTVFVSCGKDGNVKFWDMRVNPRSSYVYLPSVGANNVCAKAQFGIDKAHAGGIVC